MAERGESNHLGGPGYFIVRLAAFGEGSIGGSDLEALAPISRVPWGMEIVAFDEANRPLRAMGPRAVAEELARLAREAGLEPIHELESADVGALPADVRTAFDATERTVACGSCGAPVAPADLDAYGASCPYCRAPVTVPTALANELELYRRQLRAHDARYTIDTGLWERKTDSSSPGSFLRCAVCGGQSPHRPGVVDESCGHCGAMMVPSAQRLRDDVQDAHEQLEALRARRAAAIRERQYRPHPWSTFYQVSSLAFGIVVTLGSIGLGVTHFLEGDRSFTDIVIHLWIFGGFVVFVIGCVGGFIYFLQRHRRWARQWGPVWSAIADQLDAERLSDAEGWLTRHWHGVRPGRGMLGPSSAYGACSAVVAGFPVLIWGDVWSKRGLYSAQQPPSEFRAYVAAEWSESAGVLKATHGVRERRIALHALGFETCVSLRGLAIKVNDDVLRRLQAHPEQTVAIVPALFEGLRIVRLLRGQPPST